MAVEVERVKSTESACAEEWIRVTDDRDIRGVGALRWKGGAEWPWQVDVWVAEFLREDPLQSELFDGITAALSAVPGVTAVVHEDREKWIVAGTPTGEALVRAGSTVVDRLAERARSHIDNL